MLQKHPHCILSFNNDSLTILSAIETLKINHIGVTLSPRLQVNLHLLDSSAWACCSTFPCPTFLDFSKVSSGTHCLSSTKYCFCSILQ